MLNVVLEARNLAMKVLVRTTGYKKSRKKNRQKNCIFCSIYFFSIFQPESSGQNTLKTQKTFVCNCVTDIVGDPS